MFAQTKRPGGWQTDEKLRVMSGGGIKERVREGRGGATTVARCAPDYQPVSDALETDQEGEWTPA